MVSGAFQSAKPFTIANQSAKSIVKYTASGHWALIFRGSDYWVSRGILWTVIFYDYDLSLPF